ncbi:MAG: flagellar motor protein MotB [Elusimicrobiota bacterium]
MADRRETDSQEGNIWTTVYSDMVTNLMLFFLMLYGLTRMSADMRADITKGLEKKFRGATSAEFRAEKVVKKFTEEETATKVSELVQNEKLEYTSVEVTEKQIKIILNSPVLFNPGSAELPAATKIAMKDVARIIKPVPNTIIIEGHTDNRPITRGQYATNWELSVARAYSVIEFFSVVFGIPESRFVAAGYGEFKSVASNETEEGRARNRRIEIVMVR